ncbi:MAG: DUF4339 domain-containing protein [Verrucomicrobiota bacterium]
MSDQWFVHSNGEQMGPYTGEQLVQYAQEGNISPETMVWADGMPEWAPASQVSGLFPESPAAATPVAAATTSTAWAPPGSRLAAGGTKLGASSLSTSLYGAQAPVGGEYPLVPVKKSSFALWLWLCLGGFFCFIIAIIMMIAGGMQLASAASSSQAYSEVSEVPESGDPAVIDENSETPNLVETPDPADTAALESAAVGATASFGLGGILLFIGCMVYMVSWIPFYIYLYRAWFCLQAGGPQTTPGKAVGFLFIPFFSIYWIFVGIYGLPKDWNRIVSSYDDLKAAPRLSETTFLLFCIGMFIFPLAVIMMFPLMSQLCKGINFFAARRTAVANAGYSAFGGR